MAKVPYRTLSAGERAAYKRELRAAFLRLPRKQDIADFLFDLLTESEQLMLTRRVRIAQRLLAGKLQEEIRRELGVGFDTILTVDRWLEGKLASYHTILPPLLQQTQEREQGGKKRWKIPLDPLSFRALRRKYPDRMFLFNLLLGDPNLYEEK